MLMKIHCTALLHDACSATTMTASSTSGPSCRHSTAVRADLCCLHQVEAALAVAVCTSTTQQQVPTHLDVKRIPLPCLNCPLALCKVAAQFKRHCKLKRISRLQSEAAWSNRVSVAAAWTHITLHSCLEGVGDVDGLLLRLQEIQDSSRRMQGDRCWRLRLRLTEHGNSTDPYLLCGTAQR